MALDGSLDATVTDDRVTFELTVTNTGSSTAQLSFSNAMKADFAVLDDDTEVWRFSDGQLFAQMIQEETLDPGAAETYRGTWESPTPGSYTAVGTLAARTHDVEARTDFTV